MLLKSELDTSSSDLGNVTMPSLPRVLKDPGLLAATLGLAFGASGCSAPWTLSAIRSDLRKIRETVQPLEISGPLIQLRSSFHVHSEFSHDSDGRISDIVKAAKANGIEVIFLTDHTNPDIFTGAPDGMVDGVFFIRGEEISKNGSLLALGTSSSIPKSSRPAQEIIDEIIEQGAVCAIGHIEETDPFTLENFSAIGIHNLHADAKQIPILHFPALFLDVALYRHQFAEELLIQSIIRAPHQQLDTWDKLLQTRKVTGLSEADAHQNIKILGIRVDPYKTILNAAHTYLLVSPEWDRQELLDAVKLGRAFVGFSMFADPSGFSFEIEHRDHRPAILGDELPWSEEMTLRVKAPGIGKIRIIKDGEVHASIKGRELISRCSEPGVYRAEVWVKIDGRELPWILSSPIYVRDRKSAPSTIAENNGGAAASDKTEVLFENSSAPTSIQR